MKLTKKELELEFAGDKIIREAKAYKGDYPAFSERDLASRISKRGGEALEADLIAAFTARKPDWAINCVFDLLQRSDEELYNQGGIYSRYRSDNLPTEELIKRNDIKFKLLLLEETNAFTPRQKEVAKLHFRGLSVREIEKAIGIPKSTANRYIQAAELWFALDRQRDHDRIREAIEKWSGKCESKQCKVK